MRNMFRHTVLLFSLLLIFSLQPTSKADNPLSKPYKFLTRAVELRDSLQLVQGVVKIGLGIAEEDEVIENQKQDRILFVKSLDKLSDDLYKAKTQILDYLEVHFETKIDKMIEEVFSFVNDIDKDYQVFVNYFNHTELMTKTRLLDFVKDCLKVKGLSRIVLNMHESIQKQNNSSITYIIARDKTVGAEKVCSSGMSAQQYIWQLYDTIALADSKAMLTKLFALDIEEHSHSKEIQNDPEKQRKRHLKFDKLRAQEKIKYLERTSATLASIADDLAIAPRELWRCDPANHQRGKTYAKVGPVFQGHFTRSEDIVSNQFLPPESTETYGWAWFLQTITNAYTTKYQYLTDTVMAHRRCAVYKHEKLNIDKAYFLPYPFNYCVGDIWDCADTDDNNKLGICFAPDFQERIYYWAHNISADIYYGEQKKCIDYKEIVATRMCYCTCQSRLPSKTRYFSLNSATSDINENKVVTGVQIKEIDNVFYIQIQQGRLAENGTIIGNLSWKEVEFSKGELYHVTFQQKTVYLDDLSEIGDKIVTGLRFQKAGDSLRLEVRIMPFDYLTGKLDISAPEMWQYNSNDIDQRSEVSVKDREDPSKSTRQSKILSSNNQYINFGITDLKSDVGQNTIPYIDIQPVVMVSPAPLSGAGLYHKSNEKSGGFLGLKIFNYDYSQHIA